jgi:hypothetical protein
MPHCCRSHAFQASTGPFCETTPSPYDAQMFTLTMKTFKMEVIAACTYKIA